MPKLQKTLLDSFSTDAPYSTEVRRLLQTLMRQRHESERKVFMLTSAARGEGKSTTCALMGIVAARIFHRRTLIVDSDMRRPSMHHLLGVAQGPGLYEHLVHGVSLDVVRRPTLVPTLQVISAGRAASRASEAYDDEKVGRMIKQLRGSYDLILIDAAPVVPVIEPIMIAEHVDALLLVAMAGKTPVPLIRRMMGILAPVQEKIAGAILNNAAEGLPYYYEYSYYGYKPESSRNRRHRTEISAPETANGDSGASSDANPASGD